MFEVHLNYLKFIFIVKQRVVFIQALEVFIPNDKNIKGIHTTFKSMRRWIQIYSFISK